MTKTLPQTICADLVQIKPATLRQWRSLGWFPAENQNFGPADFLHLWVFVALYRAGFSLEKCRDTVLAGWPQLQSAITKLDAGRDPADHTKSWFLIEAVEINLTDNRELSSVRLCCRSLRQRDRALCDLLEPSKSALTVHTSVTVLPLTVLLDTGIATWTTACRAVEAAEREKAHRHQPKRERVLS